MVDLHELTPADRLVEGRESDDYRCGKGHRFGLDWRSGPAAEPQWPPDPDLVRAFARD